MALTRRSLVAGIVISLALAFPLILGPSQALNPSALAQTCPCTIWPSSATPAIALTNDFQAIEAGVKFRSDTAGSITGIRFYKGAGNTGTHVGNLWTSTGTLLGSATFASETASGWQQVLFTTPVQIQANTTYVASYFSPNGYYSATSGYFSSASADNPPLHALSDSLAGGNGVFWYGTTSFPNQTFNATNYWVDVVFALPAPTSTPTATATATSTATSTATATATTTATPTPTTGVIPAPIVNPLVFVQPVPIPTMVLPTVETRGSAPAASPTVDLSPPPPPAVAVASTPVTNAAPDAQTPTPWLLILAPVQTFSVEMDPLWIAAPGEWYRIILEEDGEALAVFEQDTTFWSVWIPLDPSLVQRTVVARPEPTPSGQLWIVTFAPTQLMGAGGEPLRMARAGDWYRVVAIDGRLVMADDGSDDGPVWIALGPDVRFSADRAVPQQDSYQGSQDVAASN